MKSNRSIWLLTVFVLLLPSAIFADENFSQKLYREYVRNSLDNWEPILREMERNIGKGENPELLYELTLGQYGFIGYLASEGREKKAKTVLGDAFKNAEKLLKIREDWAEAYAVTGGLFGLKIILSPITAPVSGPKSMKNIEKAISVDPYSPAGYIEKGNARYSMPRAFGGSEEEAVELLEKGILLMENQGKNEENWYYLNALLALAQIFSETGRSGKYEAVLRKMVQQEPEMKWVLSKDSGELFRKME